MDRRETGREDVDWIHLLSIGVSGSLMNTVLNLQVS